MMNLHVFILKGISKMASCLAYRTIAQASTLFTYQPKVDDQLKMQLEKLKGS